MSKIRTISILSLCLAVSQLVGAQFVPGEMSLSQAQLVNGRGCQQCCKVANCSGISHTCGTESYVKDVETAGDPDCDCKYSQNSACVQSVSGCPQDEMTSGNECGEGNC